MKRSALLAIAAAFALPAAWGATYPAYGPSGAHYANGSTEPVCSVDSSTKIVSCTGTTIGGVGHTNATATMSVTFFGTVQCRNHGGQIVDVKTQTTSSSSTGTLFPNRNGQLVVPELSVAPPTAQQLIAKATCPNGNWTKELLEGPNSSGYLYTLIFNGFSQPYISIVGQ
jgi:hypothetical protein